MKKMAVVVAFVWFSCSAASPAADDYPVVVHVNASENPESARTVLDVTMSGRKFELTARSEQAGPLVPGDYKAKLVANETKKSYLVNQTYELLFPDGKTAEYKVTGVSE